MEHNSILSIVYLVTPIHESVFLAAKYEETNKVYLVATSPIGESAVLAAKYETTSTKSELLFPASKNSELKRLNTQLNTMLTNECRSHFNEYIVRKINCGYHTVCRDSKRDKRDRAPSRIPTKRICCILVRKSQRIRRLVRKNIKKEVPRSSCVLRLIYVFSYECKLVLNDRVMY